MPLAGDPSLSGGIPITNNPLDRISSQPFTSGVDLQALWDMWTGFFTDIGLPVIESIIGVPLAVLKTLFDQFQNFIDTLINAITGGAGLGQSLEQLQSVFAGLSAGVQAAMNSASQAADFASKAFNAVIQTISQGVAPVYDFWGDILNGFMFWFLGLFGNTQATSQTTTTNNGQINAIWAHLNPTTSGIRYLFDSSVALTANYPGTTNPSWTAPTSFSLPTVPAGTDYISNNTGPRIGVFTGTTLTTDKVHVECVIKSLSSYGAMAIFMCGNGTTGLGQHVMLQLNHQSFGDSMVIATMTGPNAGYSSKVTAAYGVQIPNFTLGDVVALEYDNANHFTMFLNSSNVGSWTDSGTVTHGSGHRECGVYDDSNGFGGFGPGLGQFVAYDF
jgi:hypothetical protein